MGESGAVQSLQHLLSPKHKLNAAKVQTQNQKSIEKEDDQHLSFDRKSPSTKDKEKEQAKARISNKSPDSSFKAIRSFFKQNTVTS